MTFKKLCFLLLLAIGFMPAIYAQKVGVKTNLVYGATTSPNLGLEMALGKKTTLELAGGVNAWDFDNNQKFKHWLVQPELRLWTCDVFNGHFFGLHGHGAQFNVGGLDVPVGRLSVLKDNRFQGYLYGAGLSYGYQWVISPRWNFEFNIGGGYARILYDKYPCAKCGTKVGEGKEDYFGVTKAGLSLIFMIK